MPEERSSSEMLDSDPKGRSHHRWRAKLSRSGAKAPKDNESRDQAIQNFLHMPTRAQATAATLRPESSLEVQRDLNEPLDATLPDMKRKPRRKPDLHVAFATTAPVIIGEGGDEAILPAIEVSSHVETSAEPPVEVSRKVQGQHSGTARASGELEVHDEDDGLFRPKSLQRRSTGLEVVRGNGFREYETQPIENYQDLNIKPGPFQQRETSGEDPKSLLSQPVRSTYRADEDLTGSNQADASGLKKEDLIRNTSGSLQAQPHLLNPATSFANSLTPSLSPQPSSRSDVSTEIGYPFPPATSRAQSRATLTNQRTIPRVSQQASHTVSSRVIPEVRGLSLRNVAKNVGEDALQDFALRVQPFRNVFLLGLEMRPEPTLQQWVTAASWWFIKGRIGLESSVRSKEKSAAADENSPSDIPQDLKQAYVDLAKACWIISDMIPKRCPEVKKLELQGPVPLASVIQSFVDVETAELIQQHLSVASNLRALTMSMKRNNRMPPLGLELQGSDVHLFVDYPSLSPSAARLLSSGRSEMVAGGEHAQSSSFFPMPVSDTGRHFNYGRMFVDVFLDQTKPESQIWMPCLLSVLRDRSDRDITVVVASQDGQVHLVIQPDVNTTLSWRHVHWKTQRRCLEVDLRADFDLRIEFCERDFTTLWGIHDYIRTVQKGNQASKSESLLFEDTLRSFQYFQQNKTGTRFPAEATEGCTLRLFECFSILMEGSGERRLHEGHRLVVVTPRNVKTLSSVRHSLGRQTPIIFSYLRDEQGAPAILLKMSKSSQDPSMVMSFHKEADRELLHALLCGTGLLGEEHCSDVLSLEKVMVMMTSGPEKSAFEEVGNLGSFKWKSLKVVGQQRQRLQVGGPKIRIWAECETGCLVDRINLGELLRPSVTKV